MLDVILRSNRSDKCLKTSRRPIKSDNHRSSCTELPAELTPRHCGKLCCLLRDKRMGNRSSGTVHTPDHRISVLVDIQTSLEHFDSGRFRQIQIMVLRYQEVQAWNNSNLQTLQKVNLRPWQNSARRVLRRGSAVSLFLVDRFIGWADWIQWRIWLHQLVPPYEVEHFHAFRLQHNRQ